MCDVVEPGPQSQPHFRLGMDMDMGTGMGMAKWIVGLEDGAESQNRLHLEPTQVAADSGDSVTTVQAK